LSVPSVPESDGTFSLIIASGEEEFFRFYNIDFEANLSIYQRGKLNLKFLKF